MRIVALGDLHCGHRCGLSPGAGEAWNRYLGFVKAIGKPDLLIANGDLIDGRGEKSGGTELSTSDRIAQVDIAVACLSEWNARNVLVLAGTPYHSGKYEEWERHIAKCLGGNFQHHAFFDAGGVTWDVRHHVGSSTVPWSRHTAVAKEKLVADLLSNSGQARKAAITLRSHVHYHNYCGGPGWVAMTLPCLQWASRYGSTRCTGATDWGVVEFNAEDGKFTWEAHVCQLSAATPAMLKFQ